MTARQPRPAALSQPPGGSEPPGGWPVPYRIGLLVVVLVGAALALAQINSTLILASDNSIYVVLGQALASGRGYNMINEPGATPMNLYPFGYPLLLAVVLRLAGAVATPMQALAPLKLVALLFYIISLPVFYFYVRRRGDLLALAATALLATNPAVVSLAVEILSEMPFLFFTLLGLLLIERQDGAQVQPASSAPRLGLACLALVVAYYMRSAGLAILGAAPLYLLLRRKPAAALGSAALIASLALPWFLRGSAAPSPETPFFARSYLHQVLALAPYSDQTVSLPGLAQRIVSNSLVYATSILPETLFPHLSRLGSLAPAGGTLIGLLALLGFVIELRRELRVGEVAVAAYWLSLSLFVWVLGFRYIIIVVPFAFVYVLVAAGWLADWIARRRPPLAGSAFRTLVVLAVAGLLVVSGLAVNVRRAQHNLAVTRHQTLAEVYAANPEWTHYLQAIDWLQHNTPPDATIMGRKPELIYLLSGRPSLEYPYTQDGRILATSLRNHAVDYILEDAFTWTRTTATYLAPAMHAQSPVPTVVYETAAPVTRIRRVALPH